MAFSLFPSYVVIDYSSSFGLHTMTLPIRQWSPGAGALGDTVDWFDATRDLESMVDDLVTVLAEVMHTSTTFSTATAYNFPDEDSDPEPVADHILNVVGTSASTAWRKAVQQTFTFRTADFNLFKLVLLDIPTDNNFDRVLPAAFTADHNDIVLELTDTANGWSGRDNTRINTPIQASATLNEKLRRSYKMF